MVVFFDRLENQLIKTKIDYIIIKSNFSLLKPLKKYASDKLPKLKQEQGEEVDRLIMWMKQKRYSKSTIDSYSHNLRVFFRYLNSIEIPYKEVK